MQSRPTSIFLHAIHQLFLCQLHLCTPTPPRPHLCSANSASTSSTHRPLSSESIVNAQTNSIARGRKWVGESTLLRGNTHNAHIPLIALSMPTEYPLPVPDAIRLGYLVAPAPSNMTSFVRRYSRTGAVARRSSLSSTRTGAPLPPLPPVHLLLPSLPPVHLLPSLPSIPPCRRP